MFLSAAAWHRLLRALLITAGGVFLAAVVAIAMMRMGYPYALEWMEGGSLDMAHRIADGLPLYARPTLDWTPFVYPPLYYWLSAALGAALGRGFEPLRLLSLLATLGSFGLIFDLVRRRTEGWLWGMLGAALYAACYEIGGGWMDLGRVDSLNLFFLLLAVRLVDGGRGAARHGAAGLAFVAAFLTKQSALIVLVPILAWAVLAGRGRLRWVLPATALGGIAIAIWALARATDGAFLYYVFQLPAHHRIAWPLLHEFWRFDLLAPLPLGLLALGSLLLPSPLERGERVWWLALALGFIGSAWIARLHTGGWNNVLLPAYALVATWSAIAAGRWHAQAGPLTRLLVLAACLAQFALLVYDPRDHLPTPATRAANDALVERLAQVDGDVWIPHHPELAEMAGKPTCAHSMALEDVIRAGIEPACTDIDGDMTARIERGEWGAILLDAPGWEELLAEHYRPAAPPYADPDAGWPVLGAETRAEFFWERIPGPSATP